MKKEDLIKENQKLKNDIKELNETIELLEKKTLNAKSDTHNARGAGRKPKITEEQKAMIQMYRAQGKTLHEIQKETGISYGSIQKQCKAIDHKGKAKNGMLLY